MRATTEHAAPVADRGDYQIYPRSFQDRDDDLRGIVQRLPYLAELRVDAVWLSPIFTSPMADFGYDIADYRDIDLLFGSLADFDALLEAAHAAQIIAEQPEALSACRRVTALDLKLVTQSEAAAFVGLPVSPPIRDDLPVQGRRYAAPSFRSTTNRSHSSRPRTYCPR